MSRHQKVTNQQIADAYQQTGSVWKAGKTLGICGQSVHERLRTLGIRPAGSKWSTDEITELELLVHSCTVTEIASRLGRPYAAIACKISELGIGSRHGNRVTRKIPRGVGYDKASVARYVKEIDASGVPVTRYAKSHGLSVEMLAHVLEKYQPDWWAAYRRSHSDLPESVCPYCGGVFIPSTGKQVYCTRRCAALQRTDESYFGGKRRQTVGLAENTCQLCGRKPGKGISSHHVFGKENDPENDVLIALCAGCHQIITFLGGRDWSAEQWEAMISLAFLRRNGAGFAQCNEIQTLHVTVDIDVYEDDEDERYAEAGQPTGALITLTPAEDPQ